MNKIRQKHANRNSGRRRRAKARGCLFNRCRHLSYRCSRAFFCRRYHTDKICHAAEFAAMHLYAPRFCRPSRPSPIFRFFHPLTTTLTRYMSFVMSCLRHRAPPLTDALTTPGLSIRPLMPICCRDHACFRLPPDAAAAFVAPEALLFERSRI